MLSRPSRLRCSPSTHPKTDDGETLEVKLFCGQQRITDEVRDDPLDDLVELARLPFSVLSLRSGRMLPHPKWSCNAWSTSARSRFWLTEKLGLTSQPTASVARGAIEMEKQPSPSA
jgi:hypothetical protein